MREPMTYRQARPIAKRLEQLISEGHRVQFYGTEVEEIVCDGFIILFHGRNGRELRFFTPAADNTLASFLEMCREHLVVYRVLPWGEVWPEEPANAPA